MTDPRIQDLAEALNAVLVEYDDTDLHELEDDFADAVDQARALLKSLSYDEAGSASSQNYIDTGVRLIVDPPLPQIIATVVDASTEEDDLIDDGITVWRTGELVLTCPHRGCLGSGFDEVERVERWNNIEVDGDWITGSAPSFNDNSDAADSLGFRCHTCGQLSDLPEAVELQIAWV